MVGIFDGFEGYRVVGDDEKRGALTSALVAVDANVLLNLYRYNSRTTNDLLAIFEKLGNRLVVPYQAVLEFHRNRLKAIGNPEQATNDARAALDKSRQSAVRALDAWSKKVALNESELRDMCASLDRVFHSLQEAIDRAAPDLIHPSTPADTDSVLGKLAELLNGKVLARPDDERWNDLIAEGNRRADDSVPPGYMDSDKVDQNVEGAAGDFLVYIQACEEAGGRQMDLLIVTNDEKEDWWWRRGVDLIGPRQEMVKEFFDLTGRHLFLMRPRDLLVYSDALDVQVNPGSAEDAGASRTDIDESGEWTQEAVDKLLERLRAEGRRDLADVILEAARQGGTIDRDAVYVLCDYSEDRLLRGFTRPTARITADLQAEKLIPASVTPMLTPLYRGPGRLHAVRIPPEVTEILGLRASPILADASSRDVESQNVEVEAVGKYKPLTDYLDALDTDSVRMTFGKVEDIIGDALAPSARRHLPYWYSAQNSLGKAISAAGFKSRGVRIDAESVEFYRTKV
ncbi:PIN-like domain-containing protein [Solwaraspora sp. WMMA2101]|uniref:PIN-like domain-containing protein n=1 Tax=Solwaraspora sp. WMMA2101 TaxID=3404124 RepID=UPI003B967731